MGFGGGGYSWGLCLEVRSVGGLGIAIERRGSIDDGTSGDYRIGGVGSEMYSLSLTLPICPHKYIMIAMLAFGGREGDAS